MSTIKSLMIGQAGIGKSTFLTKFPNSIKKKESSIQFDATAAVAVATTSAPMKTNQCKETYSLNYMNSRFETCNVEIDSCDISLETCLLPLGTTTTTTTGGVVEAESTTINNKCYSESSPTPTTTLTTTTATATTMMMMMSSKFVNVDAYNVIVMCFALDDVHSFELVKSKWEIDLKKNRQQRHAFVLIGFKSDLAFGAKSNVSEKNDFQCEVGCDETERSLKQKGKKKSKTKNRSSSVNSNSSTSRLKRRERVISSCEAESTKKLIRDAKKFAKQAGCGELFMISNVSTSNDGEDLSVYDKFVKSVAKKSEAIERKQKRADAKAAAAAAANGHNTNKASKIPKSISAPISFLKAKKTQVTTKTTSMNRVKIGEDLHSLEEEISLKNISNNNNEQNDTSQQPFEETLINISNNQSNRKSTDLVTAVKNEVSIRNKLSRFAIGLGTYLVTCGSTTRTRKLVELKKLKAAPSPSFDHQVVDENNAATKTTTTKKQKKKKNKSKSKKKDASGAYKNSNSVVTESGGTGRKLVPHKRRKSWLLLASEVSLNNSTENDDSVFD